jgi:saccharopine dehydrogenase-like protein
VTSPSLTVLLLGATGAMGRRTAAELVRAREVKRVLVSGRDPAEVRELANVFGGEKGKVEPAAGDPDLSRLFAGADVVVSCAGPPADLETGFVRAALAAGVPYVSLCDDSDASEAARRLGEGTGPDAPTIVIGCGLRPGLTNLLFRLGAGEMDSVEAGSIAVAHSVTSDTGPASELHDLTALGSEVAVLSEGAMEVSPAGSAPHLVYFPEPVGWVETFRCSHPEVFSLSSAVPGLQDLQWSFGLAEKPAMDLLRASAAAGLSKSPRRRRAWLRASKGVRPLLERLSGGGGWTAARVDLWGTTGSRSSEVALAVVDHLGNLTTVPLVWVAIGLGAGIIKKPGVWAPEDVIDARQLVRHMSRRGIRVARLEPATL